MKKQIFAFLLFALTLSCQREAAKSDPEQKVMHYFLYSEKAQQGSGVMCAYKGKPYTCITQDTHCVTQYRKAFEDAVIQDSLYATEFEGMEGTICGQTFQMESDGN